jgi:hypothetical protein
MLKSKFIAGNKEAYDSIVAFCDLLQYSRGINQKTVHKSLGKLFEYIVKVRKCIDKNEKEEVLLYYGTKLAEHTQLLVNEFNPPLAMKSMKEYIYAQTHRPQLPENYEELYSLAAMTKFYQTTPIEYYQTVLSLTKATYNFLMTQYEKLDDASKRLLDVPLCEKLFSELEIVTDTTLPQPT